MPDVVIHTVFGRDVLARLRPEAREAIVPDPFQFALYGPDPWFAHKPWVHREGRSRRMHTTFTGEFLTALARRAASSASARREMYSYLAGFLCHYALDSAAHPYIIRRTTAEFPFHRSHMSFEHRLDVLEMERAGVAGEKHPVTDHYFRPVRLPACMEADLDSVYEEIYGWKHCFRSLNRCMPLFRLFFRVMESPSGPAARIARRQRSGGLKPMTYIDSPFQEVDVENNAQAEWVHSHLDDRRSRESFGALRRKAEDRAVALIEAAYGFIFRGEGTPEALEARIGRDSYLSGLPWDAPENLSVASMLPPSDALDPDGGFRRERAKP